MSNGETDLRWSHHFQTLEQDGIHWAHDPLFVHLESEPFVLPFKSILLLVVFDFFCRSYTPCSSMDSWPHLGLQPNPHLAYYRSFLLLSDQCFTYKVRVTKKEFSAFFYGVPAARKNFHKAMLTFSFKIHPNTLLCCDTLMKFGKQITTIRILLFLMPSSHFPLHFSIAYSNLLPLILSVYSRFKSQL